MSNNRETELHANLELQTWDDEARRWRQVLGATPSAQRGRAAFPTPPPAAGHRWIWDVMLAVALGVTFGWLLFWGLSK